jgi:putative ABC transport system permease protein
VRPGLASDFSINQLSQVTAKLDALFGVINVIGGIIAAFSLIVGGFGIANIMFVTVKERTKIIGLKKAIGARPSGILAEFLIEAVTLCVIGGSFGIVAVLLLGLVMTNAADFPVSLSVQNFSIGIGISALVGILAGYIPARTASRLDPVVAIRSQ